jgi:membrane-bound lytic murein transglycosylase MltF
MSASLSGRAQPGVAPAGTPETLRVEAVFHDVDEQHADMIAAEMVSRAHELANLPEWECDVDVNVQLVPPNDDSGASSADAR